MTPERWRQITDLFEAACARDADARPAFLTEACAGDEGLRREVEAMLRSHEQAPDFIEEPAVAAAARQGGAGGSLAGQTVAHYQVLSLLGSGGMGDVYLALDTRLGRRVALKLLPEYLSGDERRARMFTKEARAASALNHPNVITVYDVGQAGGRFYIAMEYVEGETLGAHIHRERTPLGRLLRYLQQAAEGLAKAHAGGIVHRDLKPDNIMVTRDGYAKVLDFGLAKLVEQPLRPRAGDASEVATALLPVQSLPGMVIGTAGYMSPEQAQGKTVEIDQRSDIFSFGCILYEAGTGRKAFEGEDVLDSLHKVVHAPTPRLSEVGPQAPAGLDRIVRRCLQKDPEKRYQSIKDVALELEELQQELKGQTEFPNAAFSGPAQPVHATAELSARPTSSAEYLVGEIRRHRAGAALVAAALVFILVGAGLLFFLAGRGYFGRQQAAGNAPVSFERMKLTRLTTTGKTSDAAISPDGKYVAYMNVESRGGAARDGGTASIWLRQLATGRDIKIVEPEQFISKGMTFSPDSNYLYYRTQPSGEAGWMYRISVLGGAAQKVVSNPYSTVSFSPDGKRITFIRNHSPVIGESNVVIANVDGTDERIITTHKASEMFALPSRPTAPAWSPDGKVLACMLLLGFNGSVALLEVQVEGGAERQIGTGNWSAIDAIAWLPDGTGLMITARDPSSPQTQIWHVAYPSGEARRVTNDLNEYVGMSLTADAGAMVVAQAARETELWLVPVDHPAEARAVTSGKGKADGNWGISWTPDGRLVYGSDASGNRDLWLLDPAKGTQRQLTKDARQNFYPRVTPDGQSVLFFSDRGDKFGLWRMDIDGGNQRQLLSGPLVRFDVTPDGQWIVYSSQGNRTIPSLWRARIDGSEPVELNNEHWEENPAVSPDGKQIAFQYFSLGVRAFNIGQIPIGGGQITKLADAPYRLGPTLRWTPDGNAIAYLDNRGGPGQIWALPTDGGPPRKLTDFKSDYLYWFDFSPDGKQLAVARGTTTNDVVLISNFR